MSGAGAEMGRDDLLIALRTQPFDLLVIGGGIVGASIARDAVLRGLKVALVEQGDFAGGTSSKTSKLIHGGLRYLEQGRLGLVAESVQERHILQTIAPELVRPLSILLPIYRGDRRGRWTIAAGLTLYDLLSFRHHARRHRMLSAVRARQVEPRLGRDGLHAAGLYTDAQMDDARLCLANALQAIRFGAACCNYAAVRALLKRSDGELAGAVVEDLRSGASFEVRAAVVVNSAGPWGDAVRRLSDADAGTRLAPTKGAHLVLPRLTSHGLFFRVGRDQRMVFLLPWGDVSILGTTESADIDRLEALSTTREEADYLLAALQRVLPEAGITAENVLGSYAGARPLLSFSGSPTTASREHRIEIDAHGLVSVMGGKYTTARVMAQQTVDAVIRRWRFPAERCLTDQLSLLEPTHPILLSRWQEVTARIAPELLARLLTTYGTGAFRVLELVEFEPQLLQPVCPHHDVIAAELVHIIREEMACTISDVLLRRTRIAYSACQGLDLLALLSDLFQRYGRCSPEEVTLQRQAYRRALASSLSFRQPPSAWADDEDDESLIGAQQG